MFFHSLLTNNQTALICASYDPQNPSLCNLLAKSESHYLVAHIFHALKFLLLNDC